MLSFAILYLNGTTCYTLKEREKEQVNTIIYSS